MINEELKEGYLMKLKGLIAPKKNLQGYKLLLVCLPMFTVYFLLKYLPMEGLRYAFYNYKPGYELSECEFVGFQHFITLFKNPVMRRETFRVLRNTIGINLIGYATSFLPMMFAIFLSEIKNKRYKKFVQTVSTIPNFVSWITVFSLTMIIFSPTQGLVPKILSEFGISTKMNIFSDKEHVWLEMWLLNQWKSLGWSAVVYIAALAGIDQEMFEAAAMDGAGRFARIWYITIPSLMPTFLVLFIMSIGHFLGSSLEQPLIYQTAFNKGYIETLSLYTYNLGIGASNYSLSTAIGLMVTVVGLVLLVVSNWLAKKIRESSIF